MTLNFASVFQIRRIVLICFFVFLCVLLSMSTTPPAQASGPPYNIDATGGDCSQIGTWDAGSHTCTLNQNISTSGVDAIHITGDGVVLDGAGHTITGNDTKLTYGITASNLADFTIKHVNVSHFYFGIGSQNCSAGGTIYNNKTTINVIGITISSEDNITLQANISSGNGASGFNLNNVQNAQINGNTADGNGTAGIFMLLSGNSDIRQNNLSHNHNNIDLENSNNVRVVSNTLSNATASGIRLDNSSSNNDVLENDFISNSTQASLVSGTGNEFSTSLGNYWSDHNTPAQGCHDINSDGVCDSPFSFTPAVSEAITDNAPVTLPHGWMQGSAYWAWYDDINADNWILLGNAAEAGGTGFPPLTLEEFYRLKIGGNEMPLPAFPGLRPGELPAQQVIAQRFGTINGPVKAEADGLLMDSERTLWPRGGSSLEEVPGAAAYELSNLFYWTWYDERTPGMLDWVIISNPNNYSIYYEVTVQGALIGNGTVAAGSKDSPMFPGVIGGPVQVQAWTDAGHSEPARIMASQRVLSNFGGAFNEAPGIPANSLGSHYYWTWYDEYTPGAMDWVLIANPHSSNLYYEIDIAGVNVMDDTITGPIAPGQRITPTFPGRIGGPVEVKTWTDPGHTSQTTSVASLRSLWGPSFEEVSGSPTASISFHFWTWYDQLTPGMANWVLIANPNPSQIYYQVTVAGNLIDNGNIPANGMIEHTYPGLIGGIVMVRTWQDSTRAHPANSVASQRVLYNGYFNEVPGNRAQGGIG